MFPRQYTPLPKSFCQNALVSSFLLEYVQTPTYEDLTNEIEKHQFVVLKKQPKELMVCYEMDKEDNGKQWFAILHTTLCSVIVQEVLLAVGDTRFTVHKIPLKDWNDVFCEWVDLDHKRYGDCQREWQLGMRSFGADI